MPEIIIRQSSGLVVRVSIPHDAIRNRSPITAPTLSVVSTSARLNRWRIPEEPKSMHEDGRFV